MLQCQAVEALDFHRVVRGHLGRKMIFGFNTDIRVGDTVYHLQSEARKTDFLLETQIFVKGRCIGRHVTSFADRAGANTGEEGIHELLKAQHREMAEAIRSGQLEAKLTPAAEIQDIKSAGLSLRWLNPEGASGGKFVMRFMVTDRGAPIGGALLTSRLCTCSDPPIHSQTGSEEDGSAELDLDLPTDGGGEVTVLVSAKYGEKSTSRMFRVKNG